ncbi:tetratricopeptide repeat protein [Pseudomonas sp. LABIM340]|uniref:tetratricopeptide repeat protein n=1 Tax=Pseudomonas sp. LABIM340 TaxID=3156585 RepID=UPI0032AF96B6
MSREKADALHQQAMTLDDQGDSDAALALYLQAIELAPEKSETHYNIGLIYKYRGDWPASQRYNQQAVDLTPDDEAANWNLAIAATALRDWSCARAVWNRLGISIELGDRPIEADFGMTPVRLNADESAEVVWAQRIDPVRASLLNIPYPDSGFRHGDIVLHDGAAVGYRENQGREYPVFNVLELFTASPHSTYEINLRLGSPEDLDELQQRLDELDIANESWSKNVRVLCRQCSEGHPHEQHDHELEEEESWQQEQLLAVATSDEARLRAVLADWANDQRCVEHIECTLEGVRR